MEICENCQTNIGALETTHVFKDHIVCRSCHAKLSQQNQSSLNPVPDQRTVNRCLFDADGIRVTSTDIERNGRHLPLAEILSVSPKAGFLPGRVVVDVYDLSRSAITYKFKSRDNATRFIAAIRQVNGSLTVEKKEEASFYIWWSG